MRQTSYLISRPYVILLVLEAKDTMDQTASIKYYTNFSCSHQAKSCSKEVKVLQVSPKINLFNSRYSKTYIHGLNSAMWMDRESRQST